MHEVLFVQYINHFNCLRAHMAKGVQPLIKGSLVRILAGSSSLHFWAKFFNLDFLTLVTCIIACVFTM